jgi:hypothetical protein
VNDTDLQTRLRAVESDVHDIKTDVAVLRSEHDAAMGSLLSISKDVRIISDTLQQQHGAMKFVRLVWAAIGGLIALLSAWAAYVTRGGPQ